MSWRNDNGSPRDPWGNSGQSGPPDLDAMIRRFFRSWGKMSPNPGDGRLIGVGVMAVLLVLALLWFLAGLFIVNPAERAVITRFGQYHRTLEPGLHWIPKFIERSYVVNVEKVSQFAYTSQMLTQDENIVSVSMAIQYRIQDPHLYLFQVVSPIASLQQATASALRQVIGHTTLDNVLTVGREVVRQQVQQELNQILDIYQTGLALMDVAMQPAKPPEQVKAAFDDAIKAQEDEQRFVNQAQAYARGVVPIAEGQAKRLIEAAEAYKKQKILEARGDVARFQAILPEYHRAPELMKERLYLDTIEHVLASTSKILVDVPGQQNLLYLPIDQLIKQGRGALNNPLSDASKTSDRDLSEEGMSSTSRSSDVRDTNMLSRDDYSRMYP